VKRKDIVRTMLIGISVMIAGVNGMPLDSPSVAAQSVVKQEMIVQTSSLPPGYPGDCDIECQLIEVARQRVANLQNQVGEKVNEIRLKSNEQSKLLSLLNTADELHRSFAADSPSATPIPSTAASLKEDMIRGAAGLDEVNRDLRNRLIKVRMKQDVDQAMEPLQTRIDFYTTEIQEDFIELQTLNEKLQEAMDILNNLLRK
jgi:hypothetical protein